MFWDVCWLGYFLYLPSRFKNEQSLCLLSALYYKKPWLSKSVCVCVCCFIWVIPARFLGKHFIKFYCTTYVFWMMCRTVYINMLRSCVLSVIMVFMVTWWLSVGAAAYVPFPQTTHQHKHTHTHTHLDTGSLNSNLTRKCCWCCSCPSSNFIFQDVGGKKQNTAKLLTCWKRVGG